VDWFKQLRVYKITFVCLKAGMSCHRNIMGAKRLRLLTVVSLAVILVFVVNIVRLTKDIISFMEKIWLNSNITKVYTLISSSKNISQQHLDNQITKTPTGKTFFRPYDLKQNQQILINTDSSQVSLYSNDCSQTTYIFIYKNV